MYNAGSGSGGHSYSTPSSPSAYCSTSPGGEGKAANDKELAALFRAAAANVTQLYREASNIGQSAYKAGYEQCYNDMWEFVLATQGDGSTSPLHQRQALLQQLADFAQAKRLAARQPHSSPMGAATMHPTIDDQSRDQHRQTAGPDRTTIDTALYCPAGGLESQAAVPDAAPGTAEMQPDQAHHMSPVKPAGPAESPRGAKRGPDTPDLMDIEPPRRRRRPDSAD